jgi:peptidoglycan hydrolase CwlO-like protein
MIADEQARYQAAFAGLHVQGLTKQKLLSTATEYLNLVESDSVNFQASISQALEEKVKGRQREIEEKSARIQLLTHEINELHQQLSLLQKEMQEQESKIAVNSNGYLAMAEACKAHIRHDMDKIDAYIS